jgi:GrpB-like predicted nucleotidyltransferase (UPF0157 family)
VRFRENCFVGWCIALEPTSVGQVVNEWFSQITRIQIIDILLVLADSADDQSHAPALAAAGYVLRLREPDWHQHRSFKGPEIDLNLHVFTEGSVEIERLMLLRDRLRNDPEAVPGSVPLGLTRVAWSAYENHTVRNVNA